MPLEFSVESAVRARVSVRTYENRPLTTELKDRISLSFPQLGNPFGTEVSFRLLETENAAGGEKLGTYGIIRGAKEFIGAKVPDGPLALEALGYSFEKLILYLTSLGLGTCWLGGTFKRSAFAALMELQENELFPVVSPIGYPQDKRRVSESLMRLASGSDKRQEWRTLFFSEDFSNPLSEKEAGDYALPLELLRLAPSAVNKQPWRVVRDAKAYHFYLAHARGADKGAGVDLQRVDLGIAACHFHLAAVEKGLSGRFEVCPTPALRAPDKTDYVFSWIVG
jgi:nitroreductase